MFGIAGALVSIIGAVVVAVVFGPLSLLAAIPLVLLGILLGTAMSEGVRQSMYRTERQARKGKELTALRPRSQTFEGWIVDPDRSDP